MGTCVRTMHSPETVAAVLELHERGLGARRIAAQTGLPIRTITDWLAGRTPRGWQRAQAPGCERCGATSHLISEAAAYAYLLGLYLGDGHVSRHPRGVFKIRIFLDLAYPEIIAACAEAIRALVPNKVSRAAHGGCAEVYAYSRAWPCLLPQVAPGRKHERPIVLEPWQRYYAEEYARDLLRGLIHSDGCRFTNQGRDGWRAPRYCFRNYSADIRRIFCDACDVLSLRWTEARTPFTSRARRTLLAWTSSSGPSVNRLAFRRLGNRFGTPIKEDLHG
jgi:hypothetical protein